MDFRTSAPDKRLRLWPLLLGVVGASALFVGVTAVARAAPGPPADPRSLAVSVPPDPLVVAPGETASIPLRLLNPGNAPVSVTISGTALEFGDDGGVTLG